MPSFIWLSPPSFERIFGVDQIPMIGQQPLDAVVIATFFVGCECDDQITIRYIAFFAKTEESSNPGRCHGFIVGSATAPEVAFPFKKFERIDRPILPRRLDHIQMGNQQ